MQNKYIYANDSDIYDALISSERRITTNILHEFLHERGIGLPNDSSREDLVYFISILPCDYNTYSQIIDQISISHRSEKTKSVAIATTLSREDRQAIIDSIKLERESSDERFKVYSGDSGKMTISMDYEEIDRSKTRLRQKQPRKATIEIEQIEGKLIIRSPDQERVDHIVRRFTEKTLEVAERDIELETIDFTQIASPRLRTLFFTELITSFHGFEPTDVTNLSVYFGDFTPDETEESDVQDDFYGIVERVALNGESLLKSREFKELTDRGFYISRIRWQSLKKSNNELIEFEALFSDARNCNNFLYDVKCKYNPTNSGHTKTGRPIPELDKKNLILLLENTSRRVFKDIVSKQ